MNLEIGCLQIKIDYSTVYNMVTDPIYYCPTILLYNDSHKYYMATSVVYLMAPNSSLPLHLARSILLLFLGYSLYEK